jgi:eukaryotic-like serine/threonine-protein kinase
MPRNLLTGGVFRSKLFSELLDGQAAIPSLPPGTMISVWRIGRLLGRGGMSEVYLGERSAGDFAQTVAIKIIAADVDAAELLREERRILGRLRHPAIATLIDGGELESGSVWLAMEYVEGEPIDLHAETRGLDWTARIALVERLCEAVDHAHRHLLVHRDIKPSNVLVDAGGHAKLIDFGIAVAEHGQDPDQRWMTPGYAAPEQLRGEAITTATDIFQLGQLLRTLTAADVLPAPLPRVLAHDLARIIDRATAALPAQRHASAAALAADLAALRQRRPLPSLRSSLLQRLRLWRLRHAWVPWAAVPLALLLLASLGQVTLSALREADERAMALREEQVSTAIGAFFVDLFNEPVSAGDGTAGVTALLDRGQRRLLGRPASSPEVQAGLLYQLALANVQMERRDMAVELLDEAARVQRAAGLDVPLAASLATRARLHALAGQAQRAAVLADQAADLLAADGRPSRDRFLALVQLGDYYTSSSAFSDAEQVLREALALGERRYGDDSTELYRARRLLLEVLRNQWRIDEAAPLGARLVQACQRDFGADDARCVVEFIHWQRTRALGGEIAEARAALEALWAERAGWAGALRRYRSHALLFALADVHALAGDYGAARRDMLASLCELAVAEGRGSTHWIIDRGGMALLELERGDVAAALAISDEARTQFADPASGSLESAFWVMRQARIEFAAGRLGATRAAELAIAIERLQAVYGVRAYFVARAELALAQIEAASGQHSAALRRLDRIAGSAPQGLRHHHALLLAEADRLRAALSEASAERLALLAAAHRRVQAVSGDDHPQAALFALQLAEARHAAGVAVDTAQVQADYRRLAAQQVATSVDLARGRALLRTLGLPLPVVATEAAASETGPPACP